MRTEDWIVKLSDGSTLVVFIADVRELRGLPFAGVNLNVSAMAGVAVNEVPNELRRRVQDKPVVDLTMPQDGWEMVEIVRDRSRPAVAEEGFSSSKGQQLVRAEAVMAAVASSFR
ncbi:MAG: hypothetical protein ACP5HK_07330 [Acidilobus sp.]